MLGDRKKVWRCAAVGGAIRLHGFNWKVRRQIAGLDFREQRLGFGGTLCRRCLRNFLEWILVAKKHHRQTSGGLRELHGQILFVKDGVFVLHPSERAAIFGFSDLEPPGLLGVHIVDSECVDIRFNGRGRVGRLRIDRTGRTRDDLQRYAGALFGLDGGRITRRRRGGCLRWRGRRRAVGGSLIGCRWRSRRRLRWRSGR